MFLLDTNVISELRKVGDSRADRNVVAWVAVQDASQFYLSAISVMELELGVLLIERRDAAQGNRLREWLDNRVFKEFADRIIPIDQSIAIQCAQLHVPNPRPERDAFIAATALVHRMTVVTRNLTDFENAGVDIINPWTSTV